MISAANSRQPHAILDLPSRFKKGLKIERLLKLPQRNQPIRMLEIGTGSGGIAYYFANHPHLQCEVTAVDVVDQRQVTYGYDFSLIRDTHLPSADASFDVVISNHVIEHVGEESQQRHHLSEIHRVLKPEGVGYLAAPNRWMLVEPHYKLAFLSWLPRTWRTPYLRLIRRGNHYDCRPLALAETEQALREVGLQFRNMGTQALREFISIEPQSSLVLRAAGYLPDTCLDYLAPLNPTLIYTVWR